MEGSSWRDFLFRLGFYYQPVASRPWLRRGRVGPRREGAVLGGAPRGREGNARKSASRAGTTQ